MGYAVLKEEYATVSPVKARPSLTLLSTLTDEALVLEFKAGQDSAFDVLYTRYRVRILAYLRGMLVDKGLAEEVYNTTMYRVYTKLPNVVHPQQFRSYLYKAAYHSCLNANRRETNLKRNPVGGKVWIGAVNPPPDELDPETRLASGQMLHLTRQYLETLPAERRAALLLYHNDGMTYQEIADVLERPIGTVRWLIHEARAAMARHLAVHAEAKAA